MRRLEADLQAHASSRIFLTLRRQENTDECSRQGQSYADLPGRDKLSQKWSSRSEPLQEVKLLREKGME